MGKKDQTMRALLREPDVAADIINMFVYRNEPYVQWQNLKRRPEGSLAIKENADLKDLTRDVCMEDVRDGVLYMIYGIENQAEDDLSMPLRVMGYDYASYEEQVKKMERERKAKKEMFLSRLQPGEKLCPVITIVLYYGNEPSRMPRRLHEIIALPDNEAIREWIPDYPIRVVELGRLSKEEIEKIKSDFYYIAKYAYTEYNKNEPPEDIIVRGRGMKHPRETMMALAAISKDDRYLEIDVGEGEQEDMCEFLDRVEKRGEKRGEERGEKRGETRFAALVEILLQGGRMKELAQVTKDAEYRNTLYEEYGLMSVVAQKSN